VWVRELVALGSCTYFDRIWGTALLRGNVVVGSRSGHTSRPAQVGVAAEALEQEGAAVAVVAVAARALHRRGSVCPVGRVCSCRSNRTCRRTCPWGKCRCSKVCKLANRWA
jgi:hypothetical protein